MTDPGFNYLYSKTPERSPSSSAGGDSAPRPQRHRSGTPVHASSEQRGPALPMHPASRLQHASHATSSGHESGHLQANSALGRWEAALGNIEDARVALDALAHAVDDAVYLDEDAYQQVAPKVAYVKTIQAQQARIAALSLENQELQKQVAVAEQLRRRSDRQVHEVQSELDNNSAVFKLHFNEILAKNEEIKNLKAVIEGLSAERGSS